jgi:hypothetical protein
LIHIISTSHKVLQEDLPKISISLYLQKTLKIAFHLKILEEKIPSKKPLRLGIRTTHPPSCICSAAYGTYYFFGGYQTVQYRFPVFCPINKVPLPGGSKPQLKDQSTTNYVC